MYLIKFLSLIAISVILTSCQVLTYEESQVQAKKDSTISLIDKPKKIGDKIKIYKIPVMVNERKDAVLKIDFKVSDAGHCLMTYQPTEIFLNNKIITSFDFRRFFHREKVERSVKIKKNMFVKGKNTIDIRTGACDFDIDVLDLNGLVLQM